MNRVYVGFPHSLVIFPGAMIAASQAGKKNECMARAMGNSVLCQNFNMLWCDAMNRRKSEGVTHFAMCHSDIRPEPFWVDILIGEMDRVDADIISTVIAIKDEQGLSSTGIGNSLVDKPVRRLTMCEVHDLPETFSIRNLSTKKHGIEYLAVNTGLWVARINTGWADKFPGFETRTGVKIEANGFCAPYLSTEDWLMSLWAHYECLNVYATRAVKAWHAGIKEYGNDEPWGQWDFDRKNAKERVNANASVAGSRYDLGH